MVRICCIYCFDIILYWNNYCCCCRKRRERECERVSEKTCSSVPFDSVEPFSCARKTISCATVRVSSTPTANMSALKQVMQVIGSHHISDQLLESDCDKSGGLISNGEYAWFAAGPNIILYSKRLGFIISSRSFIANQKDKSLTVSRIRTSRSRRRRLMYPTYPM